MLTVLHGLLEQNMKHICSSFNASVFIQLEHMQSGVCNRSEDTPIVMDRITG